MYFMTEWIKLIVDGKSDVLSKLGAIESANWQLINREDCNLKYISSTQFCYALNVGSDK
jgi:hypothetical protein